MQNADEDKARLARCLQSSADGRCTFGEVEEVAGEILDRCNVMGTDRRSANSAVPADAEYGAADRRRVSRVLMLRKAASLIAMCTVLGGCASLFDRVSYQQMAPRLAYQGFSFEKPPNASWYLLRSQETYTEVTLRRDTGSKTHTFYARVALASIQREPDSHEDFLALLESEKETASVAYGVEEISYKQEPTMIQGQWCAHFETMATVRGAPVAPDAELTMTIRGFRCLHPAFPKATLDFFYSARGFPSELDSALIEEGEDFLRGVRIDVGPGTPAAAVRPDPLPQSSLRP